MVLVDAYVGPVVGSPDNRAQSRKHHLHQIVLLIASSTARVRQAVEACKNYREPCKHCKSPFVHTATSLRESLADHPSRSLCLLDSADYYERIHPVVPNAIALEVTRLQTHAQAPRRTQSRVAQKIHLKTLYCSRQYHSFFAPFPRLSRPFRPSSEGRSGWLNLSPKVLSFSFPNRFYSLAPMHLFLTLLFV